MKIELTARFVDSDERVLTLAQKLQGAGISHSVEHAEDGKPNSIHIGDKGDLYRVGVLSGNIEFDAVDAETGKIKQCSFPLEGALIASYASVIHKG